MPLNGKYFCFFSICLNISSLKTFKNVAENNYYRTQYDCNANNLPILRKIVINDVFRKSFRESFGKMPISTLKVKNVILK